MINKNSTYVIIGVSKDSKKYGYKVFRDLIEVGYNVVPINPNEKEILGMKVYKSILDLSFKIDMVIFVVPPNITEKVLEDVEKLNIKKVWMQPGSESEKSIEYCEKNKIKCIHSACIMINKNI